MKGLNDFLHRHFNAILFVAMAAGLIIPGGDRVPSTVLLIILASMIFVSSFQITVPEVKRLRPVPIVIYYCVRFLALPALVWWAAQFLYPPVAVGALLLTILPAGVASPGVSSMYRANVSLSIVIVVVTSVLAPFLIPPLLAALLSRYVEVETWGIFKTLVIAVFLPLLVHLPFRRSVTAQRWFREHDALFVAPAVTALVILVLSTQRAYIFDHAAQTILFFSIAMGLFALYFVSVWIWKRRAPHRDRISYTLGSGINNTALGIVLAFLYFSPETSIFMVATEPAWVMGMIFFRWLVKPVESTD